MARINKRKKRNSLILIKCEGTNSAEKIYFNNFKSRNCRIKFATGNSTDVKGMLDDLINYMKKEDITPENQDKIYLVLDTDLNKKRIQDIKSIEKECENRGIRIITSSPTFEIWYLMHYKKENLTFKDSLSVKKELKKIIPDYKETMNIYTKIVEETKTAVENAKLIEKRLKNTADNAYSFTPHSYVYEIIEEINNSNNN